MPELPTGRPRARDLGVPFDGQPGPLGAITDVPGVEVGHATVLRDPAVRTGVTALWPRGREAGEPAFGGWFSLNGNGELTGTAWITESGFLDGPVLLTNTHSVGVVRDAYVRWLVERCRRPATNDRPDGFWALPVVGETWDGVLNDINGFHVEPSHVFEALDGARGGPVAAGSVGAGTGTIAYGYKAGIGTASRRVGDFTVGALVQANCGQTRELTIAGIPVGQQLEEAGTVAGEAGSILGVVATDAPLLPHQLDRLARRAAMGLARTGSTAANGSGDLFVAFSTAPLGPPGDDRIRQVGMLTNEALSPLFEAVAQAIEESVIDSLFVADAMVGADGRAAPGLPVDRVLRILRHHDRLSFRPQAT